MTSRLSCFSRCYNTSTPDLKASQWMSQSFKKMSCAYIEANQKILGISQSAQRRSFIIKGLNSALCIAKGIPKSWSPPALPPALCLFHNSTQLLFTDALLLAKSFEAAIMYKSKFIAKERLMLAVYCSSPVKGLKLGIESDRLYKSLRQLGETHMCSNTR